MNRKPVQKRIYPCQHNSFHTKPRSENITNFALLTVKIIRKNSPDYIIELWIFYVMLVLRMNLWNLR